MRVALVHNYYQQAGGEDQVFAAEARLLEKCGHHVYRHTVHNDEVSQYNKAALVKATFWNSASYEQLRTVLRRERAQVVHIHNTLPLISPAAYYAAKAEGVAVVQTLHNYRLLCPASTFLRDGHVCEDCLGKATPWPGVVHACYRDSRAASGVLASMLTYHRARRTWDTVVDVYIALTEFAREKFIEGGLPEAKIVVKPNFLDATLTAPGAGGNYALFVGRLSEEKGLSVLLAAWHKLGARIPLKIAGDGPLAQEVEKAANEIPGVEWLGRQPSERVLGLMQNAYVLISPSICYEGFPMTLVEAFAAGLPVVASELGGMASLVEHERTGLHFQPGDPEALAAQVEWALDHPAELERMRGAARAEFETNYTAEANYPQLMRIYEQALETNAAVPS